MGSEVLIVAIVFAVPISAIVSRAWLAARRMDAQGGDKRVVDRLDVLAAENADLRKRMEVLETIVTIDSPVATRVRVDAVARAGNEPAERAVSPVRATVEGVKR